MTRIRVPIIGGNNKSVLIDTTATKGSTLGVDLLMSDGTLVTPAKLAAYLGVTPNPPNKSPNTSTLSVLWSRIIGIPTDIFNRIPGQDGMDGEDGRPGTDGKQGAAGATIQGPPGDDGFDGDPGPPGQPGAAGPAGATSTVPGPAGYPIPGEDGMDGDHGPPGERGPVGVTGISNMPGPQGVPGDDGLDGDHGPPGERGLTGPVSAIPGPPGPPGEDGMDGSDGIPGVAIAGAAPTALLGLAAILGISPNFMRSDAAPALDVTISPTWSGPHVFSHAVASSGSSGDYPIFLKAALPYLAWSATGQAADAKVWELIVNGTVLTGRTVNDAGNAAANWLQVTRTANAITQLNLGNAIDNPTYSFLGTGRLTLGVVANPLGPFNVGGVNQTNRFQDGGAAGAILEVFTTNTAVGLNTNWVTTQPATSLRVNGLEYINVSNNSLAMTFGGGLTAPSFTFQGVGLTTFGGSVKVTGGLIQTHTPGTHTIPTGYFGLYIDNFTLTGVQQLVLVGTARLRVL